jgi:hypothetical protein
MIALKIPIVTSGVEATWPQGLGSARGGSFQGQAHLYPRHGPAVDDREAALTKWRSPDIWLGAIRFFRLEARHMQIETTGPSKRNRSPFLAAFGVLLALGSIYTWSQSGQLSQLFGGLAFAALAPVWYLLPISFTAPVGQLLKRRQATLPKWAIVLTAVGMACLLVSVVLQWVA